jgi:hypothetical protein
MNRGDWVDLVIAAATAALLTYLEISRKFRFPEAIPHRGKLFTWWYGFVIVNGGLAALLYPLAIQADWIHKMPPVLRGFAIGVGYLSIVRQKFMTAPSKEKSDEGAPVGIEYVYEAVKREVHEQINRLAIDARSAAVKTKIASTSLTQIVFEARLRVQQDQLTTAAQKAETLAWVATVANDANLAEDEKAATIATYVLFGDR